MLSEQENNLLKAYNIAYSPSSEGKITLELRFSPTPIDEDAGKFFKTAFNTYNKYLWESILSIASYAMTIDMRVMDKPESFQKAYSAYLKKFEELERHRNDVGETIAFINARTKFDRFKDAYHKIVSSLNFPYAIYKNADPTLLSKHHRDFKSYPAKDINASVLYDLYTYLKENAESEKPHILVETITCEPGDLIFLGNPYKIASAWVDSSKLLASEGIYFGRHRYNSYVTKLEEAHGKVYDYPFYYWRFSEDARGKVVINFRYDIEMGVDPNGDVDNKTYFWFRAADTNINVSDEEIDNLLKMCHHMPHQRESIGGM